MTINDKKICLSGGLDPRDSIFTIKESSVFIDHRFRCNHIDADTRIIFQSQCIKSINSADQPIIIESPDTDVFILLSANYIKFQSERQFWFYNGKTGTRIDHRRYILINILAKKLRKPLISALPSAHTLTGCDTTTALCYIGKKTVYASLSTMTEDALKNLSNIVTLDSKSA